jgi:transposase InsO family protein
MIPRLLKQLEQARCEFTWRELCHELLPCATVLRWRARAQAGAPLVEQPGVKKKQPLALATVKQQIAELNHGRRRTAGTTALHQQFADAISRRRFQELVEQERRNLVEDMKRIHWLLPGAAWSIDTTEYGPDKIKITPLRDLASKYQLPTPLVEAREDGKQIALYLELMFKREGAPMFLKRDWGSPLNSIEVDEVLEKYHVLPLNSPPGYPRYNGSMERGMRDLHEALDERLLKSLQVPLSVEVELATHQLNHRALRSLGQLTPCQVYHDPKRRLKLHGASRQRIFREIFELFWHYIQCMPVRNLHTTRAAWRLVVESWLRRQGWISVTEKTQTHVSTDSNPTFSQN